MLLSIIRVHSLMPFAFALVFVGAAQGATIAQFDVVLTGDISGIAPGTVNADAGNDPGGFGLGGTATLDDAGILTIQYRANAVTSFTNTVQNAEAIFTGGFGAGTLSAPAGQFRAIDCVENGGAVEGCPFVSSNGTFPSPFTTLTDLPSSIVFDLTLGGETTFQASAVIPNTTTVFTYNLTTVPEPTTALLLGAGLCGLAASRRGAFE
ncbi:MAG: PEP-CTERM sorting domain-containing protein [bacterium]|nr:PEP-CTERM sorting domain-containing protein [bacterium]